MRPRVLLALCTAAACALASPASAEAPTLARVWLLAQTDPTQAHFLASTEVQGLLGSPRDATAVPGQFLGAQHRLALAWSPVRGLVVGVDQAVHQRGVGDVRLQTTVPEPRWRWLDAPGSPAVYAQARLRNNGSRASTGLLGVGLAPTRGPWRLVANVGAEVPTDGQDAGVRYELGISRRLRDRIAVGLEAWGNTSAADLADRSAHRLAATARWRWGWGWLAPARASAPPCAAASAC